MHSFIKTLPGARLDIKRYNINDSESLELLYKYYEYYKVPKEKEMVPIMFIANKFYQKDSEITNELPNLLQSGNLKDTPILTSGKVKKDFSILDIVSLIGAGFLNGLNPCSLSMLLFFLSIITSKKERILRMGLSFTLSKFIAYLLLGTILYSTLSEINTGYYRFVLKGIFTLNWKNI